MTLHNDLPIHEVVFAGLHAAYLSAGGCPRCNVLHPDTPSATSPNENRSFIILWNTHEQDATIYVDTKKILLHKNQIIFLTDLHTFHTDDSTHFRMLRFNRAFHCVISGDSDIGCKGLLFFGASSPPIITVSEKLLPRFETFWQILCQEIQLKDSLQFEMLRLLLKRFLILSTRLLTTGAPPLKDLNDKKTRLLREFNFLVESYFRSEHSVQSYAKRIGRSPKTLSNLFRSIGHKPPLQIIQDRLLLESERLLLHTDKSIKEIAYLLGFSDQQTFTRFIQKKTGSKPSLLRKMGKKATR